MVRNCLLAAAAALSSSAVQAADFAGGYAGLGLTYDTFTGSGLLANTGGVDGPGVLFAAGYNVSNDRLFAGPELTMELHSANKDPFTASTSYSVGLRAGVLVVPGTAIYGRLGYVHSRFDFEGDRETVTGTRFGGGLETRIGKSNRVRFELNRVNHERSLRNTQASAALILPLGF